MPFAVYWMGDPAAATDIREIARRGFNLSRVAEALNTSQPGVSRQVQLLEAELGVTLLVRRRNRILRLSPAGQEILTAAERLLTEAENIGSIARESNRQGGQLTIATSHLHARYTLLEPIEAFVAKHPEIGLHMMQADPDEILRLVESGEADLGVSTETRTSRPPLTLVGGRPLGRSLIMPRDHPLARVPRPSLADIARFPIIGYTARSRGGQIITRTFEDGGVGFSPVGSAIDADVVKAYVARGLGVGIIPAIAFDPARDDLHIVDVTRLFPKSAITISLRQGTHVPRHMLDFIRSLAPKWSPPRPSPSSPRARRPDA
ncbi:MAG: LysR substrate-binding domain-containing protein [Pseudomonadota bacterium]